MKNIIVLFIILAVVMSGCSTAYKASRTPDDVYYSPAPPVKPGADEDRYDDYAAGSDDNYLRMKVRNRYQWNGIDDYNYWNDSRYDFGYSCTPSRSVLLNPYNPYMFTSCFGYNYYSPWSSWYSPFTTIVYYKNPQVYYGNTGKTNLTAYRNRNYNNAGRTSFGNLLKQTFGTNNNTSLNNNTNPTRTFSTNTTTSNTAGGRSGGYNSSGSSSSTPRPPR